MSYGQKQYSSRKTKLQLTKTIQFSITNKYEPFGSQFQNPDTTKSQVE